MKIVGSRRGFGPSGYLAALVLAAVVGVTSCSSTSGGSSGTPSHRSAAPIAERIRAAYPTFSWPTHYHLDLTKYLDTYPKGAVFPPGFEVSALASVNECAWLDAYLDARSAGSPSRQSSALAAFKKATQREGAGPDAMQHYAQLEQTAAAGDSTMAATYVTANCQDLPFIGKSH